jgi:predicted transcriptional regulator
VKIPRSQSWIIRELRLKTVYAKEALEFLTERGLIELIERDSNKWVEYSTTKVGKQALHDFYKLIRQYFHSE